MKIYIIAAALMTFPTSGFSDDAKSTEAFTITVSKTDLLVIGRALGQLPWETANPIIVDLNAQVMKVLRKPSAVGDGAKPVPRHRALGGAK